MVFRHTPSNGNVIASLNESKICNVSIQTINGNIKLDFPDKLSTLVRAEVLNGTINFRVPMNFLERGEKSLLFKIGNGKGRINLKAHNGIIDFLGCQTN